MCQERHSFLLIHPFCPIHQMMCEPWREGLDTRLILCLIEVSDLPDKLGFKFNRTQSIYSARNVVTVSGVWQHSDFLNLCAGLDRCGAFEFQVLDHSH